MKTTFIFKDGTRKTSSINDGPFLPADVNEVIFQEGPDKQPTHKFKRIEFGIYQEIDLP